MTYAIDLTQQVALVTGASSGLGVQFSRTLAKAGATVVLAARRVERLEALAQEIQAQGGKAFCVALDVTDTNAIEHAVNQVRDLVGDIDILVNNSGVSHTQKILDVTPKAYDEIFNTNTRGAFFVAQTVGQQMFNRAKVAQDLGESAPVQRIINIASVVGLKPLAHISVYAMSKAAIIQMTKAMALEWGRYGINVNAICPGYIETEMNQAHWATELGQKLIQKLPRKRIGQPSDLDGLLLLLASEQSGLMNGSILVADDGLLVS